jgi:transposase InsO family protein
MNVHQNARLTPRGREEAVRRVTQLGESARHVARALHVSEKTIRKWIGRATEAAGPLVDRSSRPRRQARSTPPAVVLRIKVLRHQQRLTATAIGTMVGVSRATVARIIARSGWARLHVLEIPPTSRRYERARPGELLHLDIKKLARIVRPGHRISGDRRDTVRGAGWQFAHMAIDDASRLGAGELLPDEHGGTAAGFLRRTVRGLHRLGVRVTAVMTDNGSGYRSRRFAATCHQLGLRHLFTRPYTPRTNGKAERFIKTALLEWAYVRLYRHSEERAQALTHWLHYYNWHRPHSAVGGRPPITRVVSSADNLMRLHS